MTVSGLSKPPTTELGSLINDSGYVAPWWQLAMEDLEHNEKLRWPESINQYQGMKADSQVQGLLAGSLWPIQRMRWYLDDNKAPAEVVDRMARDLNLPIGRLDLGERDETPVRRTKNRFKFLEHCEQALEAISMGAQVFEQKVVLGKDGLYHYRKLANRPLQTIVDFELESDGGLKWVKQGGIDAPELKIDRLVVYSFQKRGANWLGRSILRGVYGPWLLKDRAMRVGVMNLQRAGVGTPVIEAHPGATEAELIVLNRLAERFKAGERSGGAVPAGAKLRLVGVEGTQPDAVGFVKLMNEEMSRAFMMMFMQLGQSFSGSRALGDSFIDWHKMTLEYIANWFAMIFNEHVIEDDMDWNYGELDPEEDADDDAEEAFAPLVRWQWDEQDKEAELAAQNPSSNLQKKVQAGEIILPEDLQAVVGAEPQQATSRGRGRRARRRPTRAAGSSALTVEPTLPLPSRSLRRQPFEHEINAAVDLSSLDQSFESNLALLQQEVRQLQNAQIDALHDQIVEANGSLKKLAKITVDPSATDAIAQRLYQIASLSAGQHLDEIRRQGVDRPVEPDYTAMAKSLTIRAGAIDEVITERLVGSATREAIRLTGGDVLPTDVARDTEDFLRTKVGAEQLDILSGAAMASVNDGRRLVMSKNKPDVIFASEILDTNTCNNCVAIDGRSYPDLEAATSDYPTGGYKACLGRERCRGFYVALYNTAERGIA